MPDPHRCRAPELGTVRGQNDVVGIFDDGAGDMRLTQIIIQQRPVMSDRGRPDQGDFDTELADKIDRGLAQYRPVRAAHGAAWNHHFDPGKRP